LFSFPCSLGVPCIHPVYFGLRPFAPFLYILLIKKKKRGKGKKKHIAQAMLQKGA
jgi:hypothetical protein